MNHADPGLLSALGNVHLPKDPLVSAAREATSATCTTRLSSTHQHGSWLCTFWTRCFVTSCLFDTSPEGAEEDFSLPFPFAPDTFQSHMESYTLQSLCSQIRSQKKRLLRAMVYKVGDSAKTD